MDNIFNDYGLYEDIIDSPIEENNELTNITIYLSIEPLSIEKQDQNVLTDYDK